MLLDEFKLWMKQCPFTKRKGIEFEEENFETFFDDFYLKYKTNEIVLKKLAYKLFSIERELNRMILDKK